MEIKGMRQSSRFRYFSKANLKFKEDVVAREEQRNL